MSEPQQAPDEALYEILTDLISGLRCIKGRSQAAAAANIFADVAEARLREMGK